MPRYGDSEGVLAAQTLFPQTRIGYEVDKSAACPWSGRCILGEQSAFSMQTPVLDSHEALGINAKPEDRITYQKNITCSVVDVRDLQTRRNDTEGNDTSGVPKWIDFNLGALHLPNGLGSNTTYSFFIELIRGSAGYVV